MYTHIYYETIFSFLLKKIYNYIKKRSATTQL